VVVHYPSPKLWADNYHSLEEIGQESAELLSELGKKYDIPIHIEGTGPTPLLNVDFLARVSSLPCLRYCFDCGHMHISSKALGFDLYQMASEMLPYIGSVHVWNNRGLRDYLSFGHIPVHPHQNPDEGWVDIEHFLHIIASQNDCPIILESAPSYPSELGEEDYREGVEWVKEILS
jgi:sugar phosphate isomerase/epimerase